MHHHPLTHAQAWSVPPQIAARIARFAIGQLVAVEGTSIVGSLFTQRVASARAPLTGRASFRNALSLHDDNGPVWQLLSVQVRAIASMRSERNCSLHAELAG